MGQGSKNDRNCKSTQPQQGFLVWRREVDLCENYITLRSIGGKKGLLAGELKEKAKVQEECS